MANQYTENTFKDQCNEKGVDYWTALKRREAGMSEDEIFFPGDLKKLRKTNSITINEKTYPNLKEAVRQLKPKASRKTIARKLKAGMTPEEAFDYLPNPGYSDGKVYLVTNTKTDKQYVGITVMTIDKRWAKHIEDSKNGVSTNKFSLQTALRNFEVSDFCIKQIDKGTSFIDLEKKEINWIEKLETLFPNGYNLNKGGSIGGSNKQPTTVHGIKFESQTKAAEYLSETKEISFDAAKKRIQVNRIDVRPPSKHGEGVYKNKSYRSWSNMKSAVNPNSKDYLPGIKLCKRWKDYYLFLEDMGEPDNEELVLTRVDKAKDFNPDNCKWMRSSESSKLAANYGEQIRKQKHQD